MMPISAPKTCDQKPDVSACLSPANTGPPRATFAHPLWATLIFPFIGLKDFCKGIIASCIYYNDWVEEEQNTSTLQEMFKVDHGPDSLHYFSWSFESSEEQSVAFQIRELYSNLDILYKNIGKWGNFINDDTCHFDLQPIFTNGFGHLVWMWFQNVKFVCFIQILYIVFKIYIPMYSN